MAVLSLGWSLLPSLESGEQVLAERHVRAVRAISAPSYRWTFPIPLLINIRIYVTNFRVLTVSRVFHLLCQNFSQWYPGSTSRDQDVIKTINVGRSRFWGPYLEIVSETTGPHWLRSAEANVRFYIASPELLRDAVPLASTGGTLIPAKGH